MLTFLLFRLSRVKGFYIRTQGSGSRLCWYAGRLYHIDQSMRTNLLFTFLYSVFVSLETPSASETFISDQWSSSWNTTWSIMGLPHPWTSTAWAVYGWVGIVRVPRKRPCDRFSECRDVSIGLYVELHTNMSRWIACTAVTLFWVWFKTRLASLWLWEVFIIIIYF